MSKVAGFFRLVSAMMMVGFWALLAHTCGVF